MRSWIHYRLKRYYFALLILLLSLQACEKAYIDTGSDFVDNNTTNIVVVDSATLEISTVYVDSFISSATGTILCGNYTDPQFGKISAQSFVQLGIPVETYSIPAGSVFDSVRLLLKGNNSFYGDTSLPYTISVHQLTDVLKTAPDQTGFYNHHKRTYTATPLASRQLLFRSVTNDSIALKLPAALGQDLFDKLRTNATTIQSNEQFINYFKGLAITGNGSNNLVAGFKDSLTMRLYYHKPGTYAEKVQIDFRLNDKALQFNNISINRTGTAIAALGPGAKQLYTPQTQQTGFGQYITGSMVKIRVPYLRGLLQLPDYAKIIRASLVVKPLRNSYPTAFPLPARLGLVTTDNANQPGAYLTAYDNASGQFTAQFGNLKIDNLYGTATAYTYDITAYLQEQIAITTNNKNGLLLLADNPTSAFNRVAIGDGTNAEGKTKLIIYYASVK